ncbi:MAG: hypothetical protein R3343_05690 [Nitriliruptorales bacterium]|nr:hypothetical protein [Nitriliruptorales bacterium]
MSTAVHVRFVVVRSLPMLVVDISEDKSVNGDGNGERQTPLYRLLVERGLVELPKFYGQDLPRGARVGVTLTDEDLKIEDEDENRLLRVPRQSVPGDWEQEAKRLKGTMLVAGRDLEVDPDQSIRELCDLLEEAAQDDRLLGAIVGVAEPEEGLPLFDLGTTS